MAVSVNDYSKNEKWRLRRRVYKSSLLEAVDYIAHSLTWPFYASLNSGIACLLPTTDELKQPYVKILHWLFLPWIYLALVILTFPFAVVGFLMGRVLLKIRLPYRYFEGQLKSTVGKQLNYSFATMNVCLGPEWLCRANNLGANTRRALSIGYTIALQQSNGFHYGYVNGVQPCVQPPRLGSALEFPGLDLICFQEVFDRSCAHVLIKELSPIFPYIVYDARDNRLTDMLNSGLMIASRHEITHVDFHGFKEKIGVHKRTSIGVLMCKVFLGPDLRTGKSAVGYVATTHLQAYAGGSPVVRHQLTDLYRCVTSFRAQTMSCDDHVMFDIIAGDFNFDNMSPADSEATNHPLFGQYTDVCRVGPGMDRKWAVGTERRHRTLHNYETSFSNGLKSCLDDKSVVQVYILNADIQQGKRINPWEMPECDEDGDYVQSPVGGRRRVDYCIYNKEDPLVVTGFNFVTQLASLTDHIPVSMTIMAPQL